MKVAFLNCTDELNPDAGSELTCVFLDKIPGTLEYEFDANGVEYREDASVSYEQYLLIFENKDTIYDICDAVRCTKALYMAAQNDFNNASLETLNAAAKILGVKYDKVKRK